MIIPTKLKNFKRKLKKKRMIIRNRKDTLAQAFQLNMESASSVKIRIHITNFQLLITESLSLFVLSFL